MGMSLVDAADWDFVMYSATLRVWNEREKADSKTSGGSDDVEDFSNNEVEPPSIEWMMADDARLSARGYEVN